jgi:hypothetical protein
MDEMNVHRKKFPKNEALRNPLHVYPNCHVLFQDRLRPCARTSAKAEVVLLQIGRSSLNREGLERNWLSTAWRYPATDLKPALFRYSGTRKLVLI